MKQRRAGALLIGCGAFLVAAAACTPRLPAHCWTAWWPWLRADPERGLAFVAGGAGCLLAAWLLLVTALALVATSAHAAGRAAGRVAEILTPRIARGMLEALLGAAIAVGTAGPALAGGASPSVAVTAQPTLTPVPAPVVAPPVLPPLLDLDRPGMSRPPETAAPPSPRPRSQPRPTASPPVTPPAKQPPVATHRVRPGDTLWDLAAARLPAHSSAAQITRGWQEWYLANRQQIGPDPGLLLIGERLLIPPGLS